MRQIAVVSNWPSVWANWILFFFFLHIFCWDEQTISPGQQYPGNHQPSSALGMDHMLLQTLRMCVKVRVCICACVSVRKAFIALYEAPMWISAWLRLCNHLVRLKIWIWYSFIHSILPSWSRWSKSRGGGETGCVLHVWTDAHRLQQWLSTALSFSRSR